MKVNILGVQIDNLTFAQVLDRVGDFVADGRPHYVVTPYAESIVQAQKDQEFRRILNSASLAVPDGISLLLAAKFLSEAGPKSPKSKCDLDTAFRRVVRLFWLGLKIGWSGLFRRQYLDVIKEEVKGIDLMPALCEKAQAKGWRVFLLGGWDGVAEQLVQKLKKQYNNLTIEAMEGSRDVKVETLEEWGQIKGRLSSFQPDFLFVSYGPVVQEKWIAKNLPELSSKVVIGVAGAFAMIAGRKPRAPQFLRRLGLEWLWRLMIEPARLGRIYKAVIVFPWLVFREGLKENSPFLP